MMILRMSIRLFAIVGIIFPTVFASSDRNIHSSVNKQKPPNGDTSPPKMLQLDPNSRISWRVLATALPWKGSYTFLNAIESNSSAPAQQQLPQPSLLSVLDSSTGILHQCHRPPPKFASIDDVEDQTVEESTDDEWRVFSWFLDANSLQCNLSASDYVIVPLTTSAQNEHNELRHFDVWIEPGPTPICLKDLKIVGHGQKRSDSDSAVPSAKDFQATVPPNLKFGCPLFELIRQSSNTDILTFNDTFEKMVRRDAAFNDASPELGVPVAFPLFKPPPESEQEHELSFKQKQRKTFSRLLNPPANATAHRNTTEVPPTCAHECHNGGKCVARVVDPNNGGDEQHFGCECLHEYLGANCNIVDVCTDNSTCAEFGPSAKCLLDAETMATKAPKSLMGAPYFCMCHNAQKTDWVKCSEVEDEPTPTIAPIQQTSTLHHANGSTFGTQHGHQLHENHSASNEMAHHHQANHDSSGQMTTINNGHHGFTPTQPPRFPLQSLNASSLSSQDTVETSIEPSESPEREVSSSSPEEREPPRLTPHNQSANSGTDPTRNIQPKFPVVSIAKLPNSTVEEHQLQRFTPIESNITTARNSSRNPIRPQNPLLTSTIPPVLSHNDTVKTTPIPTSAPTHASANTFNLSQMIVEENLPILPLTRPPSSVPHIPSGTQKTTPQSLVPHFSTESSPKTMGTLLYQRLTSTPKSAHHLHGGFNVEDQDEIEGDNGFERITQLAPETPPAFSGTLAPTTTTSKKPFTDATTLITFPLPDNNTNIHGVLPPEILPRPSRPTIRPKEARLTSESPRAFVGNELDGHNNFKFGPMITAIRTTTMEQMPTTMDTIEAWTQNPVTTMPTTSMTEELEHNHLPSDDRDFISTEAVDNSEDRQNNRHLNRPSSATRVDNRHESKISATTRTVIIAAGLISLFLLVALTVGSVCASRYVKRSRQLHGKYNPAREENAVANSAYAMHMHQMPAPLPPPLPVPMMMHSSNYHLHHNNHILAHSKDERLI